MFGFKRIEGAKCPWCLEKCCSTAGKQYSEKRKLYLSLDVGILLAIGTLICIYMVLQSFARGGSRYRIAEFSEVALDLIIIATHNYYPWFKDGERKCASEPELGTAGIHWYSIRRGGIGLPRLRLVNNMIFPVSLIAADGTPVSPLLYVRIQKRYGLFWKKTRVRMAAVAVQDPNEERNVMWYRADKFFIYNNGAVIGEGKIVPSELKC